jgi:signal transduction histidine kinase
VHLWELGAIVGVGGLAVWLVRPTMTSAVVATAIAAVTFGLAALARRPVAIGVGVLGLVGAVAAIHSSARMRAVESHWAAVNESLLLRASRELDAALGESVELVEALANRGAGLSSVSRAQAFSLLEGGLAGRSPERGVVVFDEFSQPWAWAGRLRIPVEPTNEGLRARITPFYVIIEAEQRNLDRVAIGQVVLGADSAIPNRDLTVARRFARATGSRLEFFEPRNAPSSPDIFDYCQPDCASPDSDTLFAVRAVPPGPQEFLRGLTERGGRRVAIVLLITILLLVVRGQVWSRWLSVLTGAMLLVATPFATHLGLGDVFFSQSYFLALGDWLSASAGTLFVIGGLCITIVGARWRSPGGPNRIALVPALFIGVVIPFLLPPLATGVTLLPSGPGVVTWIGWTTALAISAAGLTVVAARSARLGGLGQAPFWLAWALAGGALVVALVGLWTWRPATGLPGWYPLLWVPLFAGVLLPTDRRRLILGSAIVSGAAGTVFIWGATLDRRLTLAERDVSALTFAVDPWADVQLDSLGRQLQARAVPRSAAQLYASWRHSSFSDENYPARLSTWTSGLARIAHVELASLSVPESLVESAAGRAVETFIPQVTRVADLPGIHYILAVPYPGGEVVTVVIGPRSRSVVSSRVSRFLRGDVSVQSPYDMVMSERRSVGGAPPILTWRRNGFTVEGEQSFGSSFGGEQNLRVNVSLGNGVLPLFIHGALLTILSVLIVASLWGAGELLRDGFQWSRFRVGRPIRSYRIRLTVVLGAFVLIPTLLFAVWSIGRIRGEVSRTRDLVLEQALRDAATGFALTDAGRSGPSLDSLARQFNTELILYVQGVLADGSEPVLEQLGLVEPYLAPPLFRELAIEDGLEVVADRGIAGRPIRIAYRSIGGMPGRSVVIAAPRLTEVRGSTEVFAVILAIVLGLAAAVGMAARAAGTLALPVQALRTAAAAVGRGKQLPTFAPDMPAEFVPVVDAFERMASDVRSHQAALERALKFTEAILSNVATGVIALDRSMRVTTANPRAIALLGSDPDRKTPIGEGVVGDWESVWEWVRVFMESEESVSAREFTVGDIRVRAQVAALRSPDGGAVLALDDTTDLAMAERVLAWGEMARQVAHEIKNPLTPIRLGIQHLRRAYENPRGSFEATLHQTSQRILDEIERLDAIARAFSRFGAPPAEASPLERVDVVKIAQDTVSLYSMGGGTEVSLAADGALYGRVRKDELKEVLVNLIENARSAGATRVRVAVGRSAEGAIRFTVRDNGRGIPPDNLSRIFEPQFSTTTSGTGLGLAICKRLVESWGGRITVYSRASEGTTMEFEIG